MNNLELNLPLQSSNFSNILEGVMKTFLLLVVLSITLMQVNTSLAQSNPCPCDCDEILSSGSLSNHNNYLHTVRANNPNCYKLDIVLKACGNRTIQGFSVSLPSPNCFEGNNYKKTTYIKQN